MPDTRSAARLSEAAFRERLDQTVAPVLQEANGIYRKQRIRLVFIGMSTVLAISLSILAFFPSLMVVFFLILYVAYRLIFGKRIRRKRIKVTEDLKRLSLRAIVQSSISGREGYSFTLLTHRFMPPFVFVDSKLHAFKPDRYKCQDMVEIQMPQGKLELAWLSAEEHIDAFEHRVQEETRFEGWLFRLLPKQHMGIHAGALSGFHDPSAGKRARLGPDEAWMTFAESDSLYQQGFFQLNLNYPACYALYGCIQDAFACLEGPS